MNNKEFDFLDKAKIIVSELETRLNTSTKPEDVFIVWTCKTLQNNKAILSTPFKYAKLYECTKDGDKGKLYIDGYHKDLHKEYDLEED